MSSEEPKRAPRVLVVDDNAGIVEVVVSFLEQRGVEAKGLVESREAFETIQKWQPDVLILDLMMKKPNGLQVLERIRQESDLQDFPVLILTAVNDRRGIMAAAKLKVSAYLIKPFDSKTLIQKLEDILIAKGLPLPLEGQIASSPEEEEELLLDNYDKTVLLDLSKVEELPAMPFIVNEVREAMQNDALDARKLARIIEKDHAIVGHLLRIANSVHYAQSREVKDIDSAIVVVGFQVVFNIVITLAVMEEFDFSDLKNELNAVDFWAHSFAVATLARRLSVPLGCQNPGDAFIGGVVHDLGKNLISLLCANTFYDVLAEARKNKCWLREVEQERLGVTHTQVGGQAARSWDFPPIVRDAMRLHHIWNYGSIDDANEVRILRSIYIADHIARAANMGYDGDSLIESIPNDLWTELKCTNPKIIEETAQEAFKEWARYLQPLGITGSPQSFDVERFFKLQEEDQRPILHIFDMRSRPLNIPYFVLLNTRYKPVYHRNFKSLEHDIRLNRDIAGILVQGPDPVLARTHYQRVRDLPLDGMQTLPICYVREIQGGSGDEDTLSENVVEEYHLEVIQEPVSRESFLVALDDYVTAFRKGYSA